jgi:hypothetical protein
MSCVYGISRPNVTSAALIAFSTACWAWNPMTEFACSGSSASALAARRSDRAAFSSPVGLC